MLAVHQRAASSRAAATIRRLMATAAPRIGDTKVQMSLLEPGRYINYQRIEDNLAIVRKRCVQLWFLREISILPDPSTAGWPAR